MPRAHINGIQLYYESTGEGFPLVLAHEFAGDFRSWETASAILLTPVPRHYL